MNAVKVGDITISNDSPFVLIAGTCVIEGETLALKTAEAIKKLAEAAGVPFIFKASYDKANKTIPGSYRGPGLTEGLRILEKIKKEVGVPVTSDVHWLQDVDAVSEVLDLVQIPASLCKQIDLVLDVAKKAPAINIKKGQFVSPWNMRNLVKAIEEKTDNRNIILMERGTLFGIDTMVNDFRSLDIMKSFGYPVFFDASHSCGCPGDFSKELGGSREFIPSLTRAAAGVGVAGIFLEVHEDPGAALSDADGTFPMARLSGLLTKLKAIDGVVKQ
ncbi:2-Keto-3-deoxy-D-manno-octulosonate-8-phosphate synthase [hydrothermal vent metagenome]|uniref:3-deoxy-8-phosphooctulonate synthase n=1 Tax=hydrothermal vent metagenome TaxID=652676 RepID=A0A3B0RPQ7_9ZZZZ